LLRRVRSGVDRRLVTLTITSDGEALLNKLGSAARSELREVSQDLVDSVLKLTGEHRPAKGGADRLAYISKAGK
jgi:DNA-binding MarR family transcriptional regulator